MIRLRPLHWVGFFGWRVLSELRQDLTKLGVTHASIIVTVRAVTWSVWT